MGKTENDKTNRLQECFLEGYRQAAATMESVEDKETVQPIYAVGSILEDAITAQTQIRKTLDECRQAAEGIKSLPKEAQEVARVELQQNLKHLLECCDAVTDHVRTSSGPAVAVEEKGQDVDVEKEEDGEEKAPPQTETGKKRSHRR